MSERPSEALLVWAAMGSRISGFHHDSASKLQSLMMALDEATELSTDLPDLSRALETATGALRQLHALLTENRALAKAPVRKSVPLSELLHRASARHGVKLTGELSTATVHVAPPSITHAVSMLLDQLAGPQQGARTCAITVVASTDHVSVAVAGVPGLTDQSLVVARFLLEREDATLAVTATGVVVQLPTSARSAADKP